MNNEKQLPKEVVEWVNVTLRNEWPRQDKLTEIITKSGYRTLAKFKDDGYFYASRKVKYSYKAVLYWAYAREAPNAYPV